MFQEQRKHERRPLRTQIELLLPGRPPVGVRTTDISVGGIGFVAVAQPPMGLGFELRIPLPKRSGEPQVFTVRARVQHSVYSAREAGFRVGMVFVQPSDALVVAIGDLLAR